VILSPIGIASMAHAEQPTGVACAIAGPVVNVIILALLMAGLGLASVG
jgi:hypothetical protein